jgi:hypothetical protein
MSSNRFINILIKLTYVNNLPEHVVAEVLKSASTYIDKLTQAVLPYVSLTRIREPIGSRLLRNSLCN